MDTDRLDSHCVEPHSKNKTNFTQREREISDSTLVLINHARTHEWQHRGELSNTRHKGSHCVVSWVCFNRQLIVSTTKYRHLFIFKQHRLFWIVYRYLFLINYQCIQLKDNSSKKFKIFLVGYFCPKLFFVRRLSQIYIDDPNHPPLNFHPYGRQTSCIEACATLLVDVIMYVHCHVRSFACVIPWVVCLYF